MRQTGSSIIKIILTNSKCLCNINLLLFAVLLSVLNVVLIVCIT